MRAAGSSERPFWAWGSKKVSNGGATDPFDGYRIDTSDLAEWTTDGNVGSQAGIRKVAQDGTAASALYTTLPAPFRVGSFPGAPKVAGSPTTRPISCDGTSSSEPSSIPSGTTHSARSGRGAPGIARPAVSMPT